MNRFVRILPLVIASKVFIVCHFGVMTVDVNAAVDERLQFNRDVRPILSKHCFACHGPDEQSREAGFRFDVRDSALAEADSGERPIVPGDLAASELIRRIETAEKSERMPPQPHKRLTSAQKETPRLWIASGAKYQSHWSFEPPRRQKTPAVRHTTWPRNAIDHFTLARWEREGLVPSPEVNRETLIRRVTLDLTGLPPAPDRIDAFLHDTQKGAYERLVDRLMQTTAYAERRAQDWLDLARYADTRGFADDKMRQIWPYRDWVFVDGVEDKAARLIGNVPNTIARSDRRLVIGAGYSGTPEASAYRFEGDLSEVRLYAAALGDQINVNGENAATVAKLHSALRELDERIAGETETVSAVPVMRERSEPRDTFIHVRGNFWDRGQQVFPAVPAMFGVAESEQPQNRAEFAHWLFDGRNPLVARVVVNRF